MNRINDYYHELIEGRRPVTLQVDPIKEILKDFYEWLNEDEQYLGQV